MVQLYVQTDHRTSTFVTFFLGLYEESTPVDSIEQLRDRINNVAETICNNRVKNSLIILLAAYALTVIVCSFLLRFTLNCSVSLAC